MNRIRISIVFLALAGFCSAVVAGVEPSPFMNYEGVLRDSDDNPRGTPTPEDFAMIFRFYDADVGGNEILVDTHSTVTVTNGLFNVQLGSGTVTDGSGPGTYASLPEVFRDFEPVYMEVTVGAEALSPRLLVGGAAYAMNAQYVKGLDLVSDGPLDLYVKPTGDDNNDGLSPGTAKQTIQAAVDAIPAMIYATVTVHIDPGTYEEAVWIMPHVHHGLYAIVLEGNPSSPGGVVLDGLSVVDNHRGITVMGDPIVIIRGITITGFDIGLSCLYGGALTEIEDSVLVNNERGIEAELSGTINVFDTTFSNNVTGIAASKHGTVGVWGATNITGSPTPPGHSVYATECSVVFFDTDDPPSCHITGVKRAETSSSIQDGGTCTGGATCEADAVSTCRD